MVRAVSVRSGTVGILALVVLTGYAAAIEALPGPWTPAADQVEEALARRQYTAALRAANGAYALAQGSERWDGMVFVGDLYRRIGEATGLRLSFEAKARAAYQRAFFRARQQASVDGVLRAMEGYAALGDDKMVALGLRVAERLAAGDREAQAGVRAFRARFESNLTARDVRR